MASRISFVRRKLMLLLRIILLLLVVVVVAPVRAFAPLRSVGGITPTTTTRPTTTTARRRRSIGGFSGVVVPSGIPLFMGRAAAVRANTKAKTDAKKAKTNAIFGKKIMVAVKEGGGSTDPTGNRALADVIKQARANSVPVENIQRAIKKATEAAGSGGADYKESTFEAYGVGGASMVINVLSDNHNRATSDVKAAVNKREGKIAEPGSVLFLYDRRGVVEVPTAPLDEEAVLEAAIDAGIEEDYEIIDVPGEDDGTSSSTTYIYTDPKEVSKMVEAVNAMGFDEGVKMSLRYISKAPVECSEEDFEKNMAIIDALEDLDDVDSVEHNMSN